MYKVYLFILCIITLISCHKENLPHEFLLKGEVNGINTNHLTLTYIDKDGNRVDDSINVDNNKFSTKGNINGATLVTLKGNTESNNAGDPNIIQFFLEPKEVNILLLENNFKDANIKGSYSQEEYEVLRKKLNPFINITDSLVLKRNGLIKQRFTEESSKSIIEEIRDVSIAVEFSRNQLKLKELEFVKEKSNSPVSVFIVRNSLVFGEVSVEFAELFYNNLDSEIRKQYYGISLKKLIKNSKDAAIGFKAPNFIKQNSNGKSIDLSSFKGSYILLDFWADWCKPCKIDQPKLKDLHKAYKNKGLEIIGVSYDRDKETWLQGIQKEEIAIWHHVLDDSESPEENSIGQKFNVKPIPAYILIDTKGIIIGRYASADKSGENKIEDLEQDLKEIFE